MDADINQKYSTFEANNSIEIPTTDDGLSYDPAPYAQYEQAKYRFFRPIIEEAEEKGYQPEGKPFIPKDKAVIAHRSTKKIYLHPDMSADVNRRYAEYLANNSWHRVRAGADMTTQGIADTGTLPDGTEEVLEKKKQAYTSHHQQRHPS